MTHLELDTSRSWLYNHKMSKTKKPHWIPDGPTPRKRGVWTKETPKTEGWYWIRYRNKRNRTTVCPCFVTIFNSPNLKGNLVHTARNDTFMEGPNHGGWGLKYDGVLCKSIRFGPAIPEPPDP